LCPASIFLTLLLGTLATALLILLRLAWAIACLVLVLALLSRLTATRLLIFAALARVLCSLVLSRLALARRILLCLLFPDGFIASLLAARRLVLTSLVPIVICIRHERSPRNGAVEIF
jgi:hypothetical protein